MIKIKQFNYVKKSNNIIKRYTILLEKEDEDYIYGVNLERLNNEEIEELINLKKEEEERLKNNNKINELKEKKEKFFKKAYRRFLKKNILDEFDKQKHIADNKE